MRFQYLILLGCAGVSIAPSQIVRGTDSSEKFYQAIRNDDAVSLRALIRTAGADVKDKTGATPLMLAAAFGSLPAMKSLVDAGSDVNSGNEFGATALMWCATDEAKVRYLLSKGADVNTRSKKGKTAILIASGTQGGSVIVRLLLDKGADVKKADATPVDTPLVAAADANDTAIMRLLLDHGAEVNGPAGQLALADAAAHGNLEITRLLLRNGVRADAAGPPDGGTVKNGNIALGLLTPLHLAVALGGPEVVKLLLDNRANVNAQDIRGVTPLMLALAVDHCDPRVVQLLLSRGADPAIRSKAGETAMDWALKFNHPEMLRAMKLQPLVSSVSFNSEAVPTGIALKKSAELLQRTSGEFFMQSGCPACHSQYLASMALSAVRKSGNKASTDGTDVARLQQMKGFWLTQEQGLLLRNDAPGGHNMTSFGLLGLSADGWKPDLMTDAMVHNIAAQQQLNGNWHNDGVMRPPMSDGDFTHTAIAIRALGLYGPPARRAELSSRIARGVVWLRNANPITAEDYDMRLLGLVWGGAERAALDRDVRIVAAMQRSDGGWGQTPYLNSDAYATGQTLTALSEAGMSANDPVYRKGVDFLLRTQQADGSWHVASRAPKFQPYFNGGFPGDHDQWISMAGTAWAAMALSSVSDKI